MCYVYILVSQQTGGYYAGSTQDIPERLREHNAGKSLSTRAGIPWRLLHIETCSTRSAAMRLERKIKGRGIARYLEDLRVAQNA